MEHEKDGFQKPVEIKCNDKKAREYGCAPCDNNHPDECCPGDYAGDCFKGAICARQIIGFFFHRCIVNVFSEKCLGASQGELLRFAVRKWGCVKRIFVGYPYAVARRKLCDNMCPISGEVFEGGPF